MKRIEEICNQVQESLIENFWSDAEGTFVNHFPVRESENWIYWWHAHSLDCLIDAYIRSKDPKYLARIEKSIRVPLLAMVIHFYIIGMTIWSGWHWRS